MTEARMDVKADKTPGQIAYEADLAEHPLFNGKPRPTWEKASQNHREGWEWYATRQAAQPKP